MFGRTASDVIYNAASLVVIALAGLATGWRAHNGTIDTATGFGLLLLFAYALSWMMATPLRIFAEWNPVSAVTRAVRELFGNIPSGLPEPRAWSMQNPVLYTLIWVAFIIAVFAPLAVRRYTGAGNRT